MPRFYFDLKRRGDAAAKGETPWTPAVGIYFRWTSRSSSSRRRATRPSTPATRQCAAATRAGLAAMGFQLFADPAHASNTVTSAHLPEGVEWSALSKELRGRGLVLAGGQGQLTGKIFRIGHLGDVQRGRHRARARDPRGWRAGSRCPGHRRCGGGGRRQAARRPASSQARGSRRIGLTA